MIHELKTWPGYFTAIAEHRKKFEVRKNDRGFKVGDTLCLREWDPKTEEYTGDVLYATVQYAFHGPFLDLLKPNVVVMSLTDVLYAEGAWDHE